ncbi:hypothetical protein D3C71_578790 [compost metagenome]|jgi:hypothetical protein
MSVRTNYYTAFTLHLATAIAYAAVPTFAWMLRGWYFPVWILICLVGLGISFGFRCRFCDVAITLRPMTFGTKTVLGYTSFPGKRCATCDESLED